MKNYYTPSEIAKMCEVSTGSVIRWIREGKLTSAVTGGGHYRVHRDDLELFLSSLHIPFPAGIRSRRGPSKRVLIVDDEDSVRKLVKFIIKENFKDIQIEEAAEGFVAGWKVRDFRPELVILDLNLPGLNGFRVCSFIRSLPDSGRTKIIAVSGMGKDSGEKILNLGADDFLAKPFEHQDLKEKIAEHLKIDIKKKGVDSHDPAKS